MNSAPLPHSSDPTASGLTRRRFLAGAGTTAAGLTLLAPQLATGADAGPKVNLGLIGCGGRGKWITDLFVKHGGYNVTAVFDYFADRANEAGEKFGVPAAGRFSGLDGYRRLLEQKNVDAVAIESPPYFHPIHAAAAVDAGKHVYCAKPIAVDVPGCLTLAETGKRATARNLVCLVDFQTRANPTYREALRRVRKGDLGKLVMGEAHYPWSGGGREKPPPTAEERLRRWYHVRELSGDFIVEQAIHALDVATWIIDADPVKATGLGGQKLRPPEGIYDHFALTYGFANGVPLSFTCIQTIPEMKDEIVARVYGSEGYIYTDYFGSVWIRGNEPYPGGSTGDLYKTGAQVNIHEFHQCITCGDCSNPTVAPSVRSNLTAILGREAAYRGHEVTLAQLLREKRRLEPDFRGART